MTQTVYGIALDKTGSATDGARYWSTPSALLRTFQDPIAVNIAHGTAACGEVVYIERARGGNVWIVAEVHDHVRPEVGVRVGTELRSVATPYYWSVERLGDRDLGYLLTGLALTPSPARVTARPLVFRDGDVHMAAYKSSDSFERGLLRRAYDYHRQRRHDQPLVVVDRDPAAPSAGSRRPLLASRSAPVEYRSAQVSAVSAAGRTLELVVAPVEQPAQVVVDDKWITELYAPACFAGSERNPSRIKVNRDHRIEDVIGVAVEVDPYAFEGCTAVVKIADTERGREAIALCQDGCLDVSAGFRARGVQWPSATVRVVTEAELHHVALVADGAYGSAARVVAVRGELASVR